MNRKAKVYVGFVISAGVAAVVMSGRELGSIEVWRCLLYVGLSALAGPVKLRLPGMEGTYSLGSLLGLAGVVYCAFPEVMLGALVAAATGSLLFTRKRPEPVQVCFNLATVALTIGACWAVAEGLRAYGVPSTVPVALAAVAAAHFVMNTMVVSGILALVTGKPLGSVASSWYLESFPYFLGGAALLVLVPGPERPVPMEAWLFAVAVMYLIHFLAQVRTGRSEEALVESAEQPPSAVGWLFVLVVLVAGAALLLRSVVQFESGDPARFAVYVAAAVVFARMKVRLPGVVSTVSLHFVVKLVAVMTLTLPEALLIAVAGAMAQTNFRNVSRLRLGQAGFNVGAGALSTLAAWAVARGLADSTAAALAAATVAMYMSSTILVSIVVCLTEDRGLGWAVRQLWSWSLPYYMVGAAAAGLIVNASGQTGWVTAMAMLPLLMLMFVSYRLHLRPSAKS